VYNLLLALLAPALALYLIWRITFGRKSAAGLAARLGMVPRGLREACRRPSGERLVWIHAVSVGEVSVAAAIMRELAAAGSPIRVAVSTTTPSGREVAEKRLSDACAIFYLPYDVPWAVSRTLAAVRPDALVVLETEMWPNLFAMAHERGAHTLIANGRISDRAFPKFMRFRSLYGWVMSNVDLVAAQSETCALRFIDLGADPVRVRVLGNVKFDEPLPSVSDPERARLRAELGLSDDHRVIVFGSTAPEEIGSLMEAYTMVRARVAEARLIIAPRHTDRVPQAVEAARALGFETALRSELSGGQEVGNRIIVVDTFGELATLYALSQVAFIGRSLVDKGGGNLLQPLAFGVPVLFGPHMQNFREIARSACDFGVSAEVSSATELAEAICRFLESSVESQRVAELAPRFLAENSGSARAHAEAIRRLLGASESAEAPL